MNDLTREELISVVLSQQEQLATLEKEVVSLRNTVERLEKENAELRARPGGDGGVSVPEWVKPNRAERRAAEREERKKRKQAFVRKRDIATCEVRHVLDTCPDCGGRLRGGWVVWTRQTLEIPQTPVEITNHVVVARKCPFCGKVHIPKLGAAEGVIGKSRVGPRLMSLIATLAIAKRMPQRSIQRLLEGLYGVHISLGEITGILHKVAEFARSTVQWILRRIRGSPLAHADETGWREDGINGYLWSLSTPELRYFHFDHSRASAVPKGLLGICFGGVLICDFYGGYNFYEGPIQRCWVHYLRDLKKLLGAYPGNESVREWVKLVRTIYTIAKKIAKRGFSESVRTRLRQELEAKLLKAAEPYLKDKSAPQRVLAERIDKHLGEMFTFVQYPGCPSGNNAAERAIRPAVIARKVSGGTRSENGSKTRTTLMSIFGTWTLQGKDLLKCCTELILEAQTPNPIPAQ